MRFTLATLIAIGSGIVAAAPAAADTDTDFARELQTYGIYGQKDFNAWIAKIVCQRLDRNIDHGAFDSAAFLADNLDRHNTTEQNWQFLGAALTFYCPPQRVVLDQAAQADDTRSEQLR